MARVTFLICDLCGDTSKVNFACSIELHKVGKGKATGTNKTGEICLTCFDSLLEKLKEESDLPPTPTKKKRKKKNALTEIFETPEVEVEVEYQGNPEDGIAIVKSVFTDEKRLEVLKAAREKGCLHEKGFSMSDSGQFLCKTCGEKAVL